VSGPGVKPLSEPLRVEWMDWSAGVLAPTLPAGDWPAPRGFHSSTSQLNLSRFGQ